MAPFGASRAGLMSVAGDDIPDSVVDLALDDTTSFDADRGVEFEADEEWSQMGFEIGANVVGTGDVVLRDEDAGEVISRESDWSAGDTVILEGPITISTTYSIIAENLSQYDFRDNVSFPVESSDGNLRVTAGNAGSGTVYVFEKLGNVGFD